jgi:uncharacterized protein
MDLHERTALVTGAGSGIGRALVEALAAQPLALVLAAVRDPTAWTPVEGGAEVRPVALDLSSRASIDAGCDALGDDLARVDLLVNNAGQWVGGLLEEQDMADVYALFQVNLVAVAHLTQRVLPAMLARGEGKIVNNASMIAYAMFPGACTYAASKTGVVAFSESLRRELRGTGVDVLHLITPGVRTRMLDATEDTYGEHVDTTGWDDVPPEEWAAKIVRAIEHDDRVLRPSGKTGLAVRAARGPAFLLDRVSARIFSR